MPPPSKNEPQATMTTMMTMTYDPERRFSQIENRMDKYDQLIVQIQRSQDRHEMMLQTFIDEMKELKQRDIDISTLIQTHDASIHEHAHKWNIFLTTAKYILGLLVSIGLLLLGTIISHLIH